MRFVDTTILLYAISTAADEQGKAAVAAELLTDRELAGRERFQLSYWDAAMIEAARLLGCTELLPEDLNDGQDYDGVTVTNPFV